MLLYNVNLIRTSRYKTIERLVNDTSPENTYRQSSYVSITGGGRGSQALFFATDVKENRRQREEYGNLMASAGLLNSRDWVVSMHTTGNLYRSVVIVHRTIIGVSLRLDVLSRFYF